MKTVPIKNLLGKALMLALLALQISCESLPATKEVIYGLAPNSQVKSAAFLGAVEVTSNQFKELQYELGIYGVEMSDQVRPVEKTGKYDILVELNLVESFLKIVPYVKTYELRFINAKTGYLIVSGLWECGSNPSYYPTKKIVQEIIPVMLSRYRESFQMTSVDLK